MDKGFHSFHIEEDSTTFSDNETEYPTVIWTSLVLNKSGTLVPNTYSLLEGLFGLHFLKPYLMTYYRLWFLSLLFSLSLWCTSLWFRNVESGWRSTYVDSLGRVDHSTHPLGVPTRDEIKDCMSEFSLLLFI